MLGGMIGTDDDDSPSKLSDLPRVVPPAARLVAGVFGFVFGGIGLTVLIFLWAAPVDDFGSPPLVFRVFGSFIAIAFVAFGGAMLYGALSGRGMVARRTLANGATTFGQAPAPSGPAAPAGGYQCPNCGAPLSDDADVSPMGDVKCAFCKTWFNIHQRPRA
jgi:hypothetical protein